MKLDEIEIHLITENKKRFLNLLLMADEGEKMIDRYLDRGDLFVLMHQGESKSLCVVTQEGDRTIELKNLATYPAFRKQGFARHLIQYICNYYRATADTILVGTGETRSMLSFYESCGFTLSHRIKNFFTDNYDHPMIEEGILLTDMIYLKKEL